MSRAPVKTQRLPSSRPPTAGASEGTVAASNAERMPVEELARRSGMTVRNLRALQAKGLLE